MQVLKQGIQRMMRHLGYELKRYSPEQSETAQLMRILSVHNVNLVLDVGANKGQYAALLRRGGYRGTIVSFEPLSEAHAVLVAASKLDPSWIAAPRMALGSGDGEIDIHIARNSSSSSVLGMTSTHRSAAPMSDYVAKERAMIARLDKTAAKYISPETIVHLKIDTQGYEHEVLRGAEGVLKYVASLQIELSLALLYEGQKLFSQMLPTIESLGFDLWGVFPVLVEPNSGRLLQVDGLFSRR